MSDLSEALDVLEKHISTIKKSEAVDLITVLHTLQAVTEYAARNHCTHEETYRAGILWEVCSMCGAKWADDEGGMPPDAHEYPKEIKDAWEILEKFKI